MSLALFLSVFLIAACGLIYELIAGTLASYLLGDSVLQFSTIIGCYLFAMGIGSYLSRFIIRGLVARFVSIELLVGMVGGFSSAARRMYVNSILPPNCTGHSKVCGIAKWILVREPEYSYSPLESLAVAKYCPISIQCITP